jgi:hypothetical protein
MNIGFNQAWFGTAYGSQYLNSRFDSNEIDRMFKLTKAAGSKSLRLWFFESKTLPMIETKHGEILSLKSEFIENVIKMLRIAKLHDVKVYMTLLDAHSFKPIKYSSHELALLKYIYSEKGSSVFLEKVVTPLLSNIDAAGLSSQIDKIDLINEGDTVVKRFGIKEHWNGLERFICQWSSHIHALAGYQNTPITYSIRLHPLITLPNNLLKDNGPLRCTDIIDFHSYDDDGDIYKCKMVQRYSMLNKKKVILGEFGQSFFNYRYDDDLQIKNTKNYISNAKRCGFSEAYAWRLSDVRSGENKEARYSFEAFGEMRPAFKVIQQNNLEN